MIYVKFSLSPLVRNNTGSQMHEERIVVLYYLTNNVKITCSIGKILYVSWKTLHNCRWMGVFIQSSLYMLQENVHQFLYGITVENQFPTSVPNLQKKTMNHLEYESSDWWIQTSLHNIIPKTKQIKNFVHLRFIYIYF